MVTMCPEKSMITNDLKSFFTNTGCSSMQFDILRFIGRHPRARFSFFTIARAVGTGGPSLGEAVMGLIQKDMIIAQMDDFGLTTYSLSCNRNSCGYIYELAALDWSEAMSFRDQLLKPGEPADSLTGRSVNSTCNRHLD
jgi:hypothetical protein